MRVYWTGTSLIIVLLALSGCDSTSPERFRLGNNNDYSYLLTGTTRYTQNKFATEVAMTMNGSIRRTEHCDNAPSCAYVEEERIHIKVDDLGSEVIVGSSYFDQSGALLKTVMLDGGTCTALGRVVIPQIALIGESGEGPQTRCDKGLEGTGTQSSFWNLTKFGTHLAEFNIFASSLDGTTSSETYKSNRNGDVLGIKLEMTGEVDGVSYIAELGNY